MSNAKNNPKSWVAIDYGLSNTDVVMRHTGPGAASEDRCLVVPRPPNVSIMQIEAILSQVGLSMQQVAGVAVTGGQHRLLPDRVEAIDILKVPEVQAVGLGGLYLSKLPEALVVSAGSGTAVMAARMRGKRVQHVTGTAVGGGTLQGLGRLLLNTADPIAIDALARAGDPNHVDLTLIEATGVLADGQIGKLPADANAVNFGKLARWPEHVALPTREDIAAGLVRLVGQVIAVIAINAARAEKLEQIVVVGHLVDLPSVRAVLQTVAGYYGANITVPDRPGFGTAQGAMLMLRD